MPLLAAINRRVIRRRGRGVPPPPRTAAWRRASLLRGVSRKKKQPNRFEDVSALMLIQRTREEFSCRGRREVKQA